MHKKPSVTLAHIFSLGMVGLWSSQVPLAVVMAQTRRGYVPPPPPQERRQTVTSAGSRGCPNQSDIGLTLLVPNHHIGTTVSEHPTLLISVKEVPERPLVFTLARPDITQPLIQRRLRITSPGIVPIELRDDSPPLEINQSYYWTVTIICNEKRPSENAYARSVIKRIALGKELAWKLASEKDPLMKAQIYSRSGIWYDAVSLSYEAHTRERDFNATAYFWQLLEDAGLYRTGYLEESRNHG